MRGSLIVRIQMKNIRVSAAVIAHDGKIFATQRGYGQYKDYWEFPGGKREDGESGEDAIIREIKEELNVDIAVDSYLTTVEYQYPEFFLVMDVYLCSIVSGEISLSVHEDARWLSAIDIDTVDWLPADIAVIEEMKKKAL